MITKMKVSISKRIFDICNVTFLILLSFVTLYPMMYIVFASFSNPIDFIGYSKPLWRPIGFTLEAYKRTFSHKLILSGYVNTLFVVIVGTTISLILTLLGAYFLSRKNVMLQKPISIFIIFTMFFSGGLIPFYFVVKNIAFNIPVFHYIDGGLNISFKEVGLYNSLWALILPGCINTFNLMVMRTAFFGVPDALPEAAVIDGCGHMGILFKIMFPLIMPTVAVIILYYGVGYWNAWFNASIFLKDTSKFPLQLVLRQIIINSDTSSVSIGVDSGEQMAIGEIIKYSTIVVATLPILIIYPFLQKYFVGGVMVGAVKG